MAKTAKAVVANRRSVEVDGEIYGPGETVTLPVEEIVALQAAGYLVDPKEELAVADDSPSVASPGGPIVQVTSAG